MKLNWGWSIAIFYILFVTVFIGILFYSFTQDNSLVVDDYYEQDLNVQDRIDKQNNYRNFGAVVNHVYSAADAKVQFSFPAAMHEIEGKVLFYRPSSSKQDYEVDLKLDTVNQQTISVRHLIPGQWQLHVEWMADGVPYYFSEQLVMVHGQTK
jgi:hypothetical protein